MGSSLGGGNFGSGFGSSFGGSGFGGIRSSGRTGFLGTETSTPGMINGFPTSVGFGSAGARFSGTRSRSTPAVSSSSGRPAPRNRLGAGGIRSPLNRFDMVPYVG